MVLSIYVGKRINSRGKVEISLRFRHGKMDQQAATNLWVRPDWVVSEEYVSSRGRNVRRYQLKSAERASRSGVSVAEARELASAEESLKRLMAYIEDAFCIARRGVIGTGWLAETIGHFHADELPRLEMERTGVLGLIDTYMDYTSGVDSSESRDDAYRLMRRSLARFEAYRRLKYPHFSLFAGRLDEGMLRAIERFMRNEHLIVKRQPSIVQGPGLEGRTRSKGPNTVNDRMKLMKAVMSWAVKTRRIPVNPFDTFVRSRNVYGTPVYLSLDERRRVERHDFTDNPRMALQRDIFIFQCCVGCRVSDLMELTRSNIIDGELNYVAKKTRDGHPVTIKVPLNRTARDILDRYADSDRQSLFPEVYSRMGYNRMIKEILKAAGITRKVVVIDPLTRQPVCRHLYEVASSHMARRTFIGNIYKKFKDQGMVSELSGHSPGSNAFARYREIDTELKREMVDAID